MGDEKKGTFGYVFAGDPKFGAELVGEVKDDYTQTIHCDNLSVTMPAKEPKVETVRELRIDYSEGLGDSYRTLTIETFATAKELRKLLRDLRKEVTK